MNADATISIGAILIKWRLKKNKTIYDCASALNIPVEYLDALEREDFKLLPSQNYLLKVIDKYKNFLNIAGVDNDIITEIITDFNEQKTQKRFQLLNKISPKKFFKNLIMLIIMLIAISIVTDGNILNNHFLSFLDEDKSQNTNLNNLDLNYNLNNEFDLNSGDKPQNNIIQITATGYVWLEIFNGKGVIYFQNICKKMKGILFLLMETKLLQQIHHPN
jgi:cytoskeletal protein RodZ